MWNSLLTFIFSGFKMTSHCLLVSVFSNKMSVFIFIEGDLYLIKNFFLVDFNILILFWFFKLWLWCVYVWICLSFPFLHLLRFFDISISIYLCIHVSHHIWKVSDINFSSILCVLYCFFRTAGTKSHKLGGLEQHKLSSSQCWRQKV